MRTAKVAATRNTAARGNKSRGRVLLKPAAGPATDMRVTAAATQQLLNASHLATLTRAEAAQMPPGGHF